VEAIYKELEGEILDCNNCDNPVEIFGVEVIINIEVEFTQADQKIMHMVRNLKDAIKLFSDIT
jgi:hypothetical protein